MTQNQIAYWKNVETERTNRAQEAERTRAAKESERLKGQENLIKAAENRIKSAQQQETARTNLANEALRQGELKLADQDATLKYFFKAIEPLTGLVGSFAKSMIGG